MRITCNRYTDSINMRTQEEKQFKDDAGQLKIGMFHSLAGVVLMDQGYYTLGWGFTRNQS